MVTIIAQPTPRTSRRYQHMATMRYGSVVVHGDGIRLRIEGDTGSFRTAALQVVCSLALWWVVAGIGDGSRWAV